MRPATLLDTGPLVALIHRDETHHEWVKEEFGKIAGDVLTCEAVLTEACFLLSRARLDPIHVLSLLERGAIKTGMNLADEAGAVRKLFQRYENIPASLADACLIRMSELYDPCRIMTFDRDFQVYRRHGRQVIPLLMP